MPPPIPPPDPSPPPTPLVPDDTPGESGVLPGADDSTDFAVIKQVLDPRGRPVNLIQTRPGRLVRFRLSGTNFGFASARDVRNGRICWRLGTVDTSRRGTITFHVRRRVACRRILPRQTG